MPFISRIALLPALRIGWSLAKFNDHGWLEFIGGQGAILKMGASSSVADLFNFVNLKFYLFLTFILIVFIMCAYLSGPY